MVSSKPTSCAHWPPQLQYLTSSRYHSSVSEEARVFLRGETQQGSQEKPGKSAVVAVRPIGNPEHPALGQFGLFAKKKILAKTRIIDYLGEIHSNPRLQSDYDLSLHRFQNGESIGIDASEMGNEARFINDYRGVTDKPNAIFQEYRSHSGELCMAVWSSARVIKKGDEILVSYGKSWWQTREDELAKPEKTVECTSTEQMSE